MKPRLLDAYCGAGGATRGYQQAGFYVVGIDIAPQPHYCGDEFIQGDALEMLADLDWLAGFDAIHASPPCQSYSVTTNYHPENREKYPDLIDPTRELLERSGLPWVIENVPGAPLRSPIQLCGTAFGLRLQRHRLVESNRPLWAIQCRHGINNWDDSLKHSTGRTKRRVVCIGEYRVPIDMQREAMEINWMDLHELSEAIPPAYTEYIGRQLIDQLEYRAVVGEQE
jgi:DNA (cytosine-5)-methyltransferase 1